MRVKTTYLLAPLAALAIAACDTPLDVDPTASIPSDNAFKNAREVELGVNGIYDAFQSSALYGRDITVYPEMYADNLDFTGTYTTDGEVANRNIRPDNVAIADHWIDSYEVINRANTVLKGMEEADDLSPEAYKKFKGEALFLRALSYLNLVNYYGGVPIILEPRPGVDEESKVARASVAEVFDRIETDLIEAIDLLPAGGSSTRASKGAAQALLARVYLEQKKDADARDMATAVIESGDYELVSNYRTLYTNKANAETIFQIGFTINDNNSMAFWYYPEGLGGRQGFTPSTGLYNAYEADDARLEASIAVDGNNRYGIKYHRIASGDDNVPVLRLAEMYLIRAEANARLGAPAATVRADIDVVRARAGLAPLDASIDTEEELIDAILQERRVEFAMEGHRFFDLRRNGKAEEVLGIDANRLIFPIPQRELDVNDKLVQNPGY